MFRGSVVVSNLGAGTTQGNISETQQQKNKVTIHADCGSLLYCPSGFTHGRRPIWELEGIKG